MNVEWYNRPLEGGTRCPPVAPVRRHALFFIAVACAVVALATRANAIPPTTQALLTLVLVGFLGMPHGATDYFPARALLAPSFPRTWLLVFVVAYVGAGASFGALWYFLPALGLGAFLVLSAVHFGSEDVEAVHGGLSGWPRALAIGVRGSTPILAPTAFHPEQVLWIFSLLTDGQVGTGLVPVVAPLAMALLVATMAAHAGLMLIELRNDPARSAGVDAEPFVIVFLFAALPPLLGFVVYFCLLHAIRHVIETYENVDTAAGPWLPAGPAGLIRASAPFAIAVVLAGAACFFYFRDSVAVDALALRIAFIGLSALLFPHMLLDAAYHYWNRSTDTDTR